MPIASGMQSFTRDQVGKLVASDAFADAWVQATGLRTGPVGAWVGANKRALRIGAVAIAALALVFWGRPTGKVVLGLTLALLVVLAIIEFLGRPGQRPGELSTSHT